jgi:hypothetical protein
MAESSENIIGWNFPNVVTIGLMLVIIWVAMGVVSHLFRGRRDVEPGARSDASGNFVPA